MAINDDIYDRIVDHMTDVRLYEESVQVQNRRIFSRHRSNLRDLLRGDLRANLEREMRRFSRELQVHQETAMREFSTSQLDFHTSNLNKSVGSFFNVQRPRSREILAQITGNAIRGDNTIAGNIQNISAGELVRIQNKVNLGLSRGRSRNDIISDVLSTTKLSEHQARTLTRTAITSTQSTALINVVERNKDIISGYMFTAILDGKTSAICSYHNGKVYDVDDARFRPPLHWNCRSTLIPVVKSKDQLLETDSARIKRRNLKETADNQLSGRTPPQESFGEWLRRQSMAIQTRILGSEEKANLFRLGTLKYDDFVSKTGELLSIAALRRRAAEVTAPYFGKVNVTDRDTVIRASRPSFLINNPSRRDELLSMFISDSLDFNKTLSLTDYRGTSLVGKQASRRRYGNTFDERNHSEDPFTGEITNTNIYAPDFNLLQERIDFMRASKTLTRDQKDFIEDFANRLEDRVSVNQQTVIVENLRVVFERYMRDKTPWDDVASVLRAENRFAVQNTSRLLDTRSRQRSEVFARYITGEGGRPQAQVFGTYYDFDDLSSRLLRDQRILDSWEQKEGRRLARRIFLSGRSPMRTYFARFLDRYPTKKKIVSRLNKEFPVFSKAYNLYKKLNKREPSDAWITKQMAKIRETYRFILDFEFLNIRKKPSSKVFNEKSIKSLSGIMKLIAEGNSTDYDTLAINIGKKLHRDLGQLTPFTSSSLRDYHAEGSRILEYLRDNNIIKIQFRGVTRRGVIDVDTGRASGGWGDTISREVIVVDKQVRELQETARRLFISRRIGNVNERDRLYVKAGHKTYFDARGKNTGIPIISQSKFADFDANQIDRDFANMLNHVMNVQYRVDDEFVDFMDYLLRFRDPRGNSKYYDSINEFRQEIISRGEGGYGLVSTAKYHRQRGQPFRTNAYIDSRGRVYHRGYLTPTGGEVARPFLNSNRAYSLSPEALDELQIQMGALIGPGTEALTQAGRRAIFQRNREKIIELGEIMLSTTQRDRRIREFLEHPLIKGLEGKEVPKMARMALEYARINRHVDGDFSSGYNRTFFGEDHTPQNVLEVQRRVEEFRPQVVYHEFWEEPETIAWARKNGFELRPGDLSYAQKERLIERYGGQTEQFHRDREAFMLRQYNNADPNVRNAFVVGNDHAFDRGSVIAQNPNIRRISANGQTYPSRNDKLSTYQTRLMIENDASSSGAQIIGLSTRDRSISEASNVLATDRKNRLYDLVAMYTVNDPEFINIRALRDANLTWEDLAKAAKAQNMVHFYGSFPKTCRSKTS
jgi:SPP1 gp7 family putative phage head morphogenesis protein